MNNKTIKIKRKKKKYHNNYRIINFWKKLATVIEKYQEGYSLRCKRTDLSMIQDF
jgi:hypothetical protein